MGRPASLLLGASAIVFLLVTATYGSPVSLRGEDRARESVGPLLARQAIVGFPRQSRSDGDKEGWDHDKTEGGAMDWYWFRRRRYFDSWAAETSAETPVYPDTQRPDTQRPDTQRPDTQRPDTQRPETKRRDHIGDQ